MEPSRLPDPADPAACVAVAVVRRGDWVLVGRRSASGPLPGLAEFPGGKVLPGESLEACAVRECREETGLDVTVVRLLQETVHDYPHGRIRLAFFLCRPAADAPPRPPFAWVAVSQLARLPFPAANRAVVDLLLGGERPPDCQDEAG